MWKELSAYEGKNLQLNDDADMENLFVLLGKLFPEYGESSPITDPYYIWRIHNEKNALRYVIVDGEQLQTIPGASRACISLFNEEGRLVETNSFSTGWRIDIDNMELMKVSIIGVPVIVILTSPDRKSTRLNSSH